MINIRMRPEILKYALNLLYFFNMKVLSQMVAAHPRSRLRCMQGVAI